ncbi:G-protein beta WD-40 repeat-containing protein [Artemisia annua]|uniref:G-protein beta WD-40 repeat-containing protein n=1 Tax=Artemisia annua TaxID=35608 RepID=A0A2U1M474_ARTAN|nr:G-protein beta WD-40 repeat-containing protein [Artemisia annua]
MEDEAGSVKVCEITRGVVLEDFGQVTQILFYQFGLKTLKRLLAHCHWLAKKNGYSGPEVDANAENHYVVYPPFALSTDSPPSAITKGSHSGPWWVLDCIWHNRPSKRKYQLPLEDPHIFVPSFSGATSLYIHVKVQLPDLDAREAECTSFFKGYTRVFKGKVPDVVIARGFLVDSSTHVIDVKVMKANDMPLQMVNELTPSLGGRVELEKL